MNRPPKLSECNVSRQVGCEVLETAGLGDRQRYGLWGGQGRW
ncbi:hypothetical protein [Actinoallomurus sp. NPDC050550]